MASGYDIAGLEDGNHDDTTDTKEYEVPSAAEGRNQNSHGSWLRVE
jgi:hypothetical protein